MVVSINFSVIFIDFNYQGKPGEKSLRSLDQVSYQDGVNRARGSFRDSYGNPVQYDTLEAIDAKKPSNNKNDPNKFLIPGYASGVFQPHEVPTRSNVNVETPRKIDDDRIHFIDPLQNAYSNSDKPVSTPSSSLSLPLGTQEQAANNPTPIIIPKPNIDAPETPETPIDDPLNHELHPPTDDSSSSAAPVSKPETPSFALETPKGNDQSSQQIPLTQDLIPPQIPTEGQSVLIPRPNIDASETPIDEDFNTLLNKGLLPPSDTPAGFGSDTSTEANDNSSPTFSNPNQDGPVIITDVNFAPKPSNGLLPPKDPSPNEISGQPNDSEQTYSQSTVPTLNKFTGSFNAPQGGSFGQAGVNKASPIITSPNKFSSSFGVPQNIPVVVVTSFPQQRPTATNLNKYTGSFGGSQGVLGQPGVNRAPQTQIPVQVVSSNKFTGTFGGSQGVLGGTGPAVNQIPVAIFQEQFGVNKPFQGPAPTQSIFTQPPKPSTVANKYQGNFGGPPGVLVSNNQYDRVTPTQQTQSTAPIPAVAPTIATSVVEKFGAEDNSSNLNQQVPTTQTLSQLPNLNNYPSSSKENVVQKYTGQFGGAPGILRPYDNSKN